MISSRIPTLYCLLFLAFDNAYAIMIFRKKGYMTENEPIQHLQPRLGFDRDFIQFLGVVNTSSAHYTEEDGTITETLALREPRIQFGGIADHFIFILPIEVGQLDMPGRAFL